jgi:phytol kinase
LALILSYVYAFGLLLIVEAIGRRFKWPQFLTRKLVHIGAGMWVWGTLALFHTRLGLIPFATFIVLNYVFYRFQIFKAMDTTDSTPGTVYFAISITLLLMLFWHPDGPVDRVPIAIAAIMAMTWGDGVASIVGQARGRRHYHVLGHQRSWEGTVAMALFSFISIFLTLLLLSGSGLSPASPALSLGRSLLLTLVGTTVATTAEGLSPAGTDNLTVPLLTGAVLFVLTV